MDAQNNLIWDIAKILLGTILGFLGKYFIRGTYYDRESYKRKKRARQYEAIMNSMKRSGDVFTVGDFVVKQMSVLPFIHGLRNEDVQSRMLSTAKSFPASLEELEYSYLPQRVAQLEAKGRTVDFNDTYSLRSIRILRPQDNPTTWRDRRNTIEYSFEPSNFKYNLMLNEALDHKLMKANNTPISIRSHLGLKSFDWGLLSEVPLHMWFSTVTNVITSDEMLVVAIRSEFQMIGASDSASQVLRASTSAAEGMLRPTDSVTVPPQELPSPFKTAERALWRELGLTVGTQYSSSDLLQIALCFDTQRYQPLAVFYLEVPITFQDVISCWSTAIDKHENRKLLPVPMSPSDVSQLLNGQKTDDHKPVELFSNHQKCGVLLAACKRFGFREMEKRLRR